MQLAKSYLHEILPGAECEKLPYYRKLKNIRRTLEEGVPGFPAQQCAIAAYLTKLITRLPYVIGYYSPEPSGIVKAVVPAMHAWNYDMERRLWVDISQDQYNWQTGLELPPIVILPDTTSVLKPEPTLVLKKSQDGESISFSLERIQPAI